MEHATVFRMNPTNLSMVSTLLQEGKSIILPGLYQYIQVQGIQTVSFCPRSYHIALPDVILLQHYTQISEKQVKQYQSTVDPSMPPILRCPASHRLTLPSIHEGDLVEFMVYPKDTIVYRFSMELMMPLMCIPLHTKLYLPMVIPKQVLEMYEYRDVIVLLGENIEETYEEDHHHYYTDSESDDEESTTKSSSHAKPTSVVPFGFYPSTYVPIKDTTWKLQTVGLGLNRCMLDTSFQWESLEDIEIAQTPRTLRHVDMYKGIPVLGLIPVSVRKERPDIDEYIRYFYENTLYIDFGAKATYLQPLVYGYVDLDPRGNPEVALRMLYCVLQQAYDLRIRHVVFHKCSFEVFQKDHIESINAWKTLEVVVRGLTQDRTKTFHMDESPNTSVDLSSCSVST